MPTVRTSISILGGAAALLLAAAPAIPAAAQGFQQQVAGRWQCQGGVRDPQGKKITVGWSYGVLLYPNGTFRGQGWQQGGVVRSGFQVQGRWQVGRGKDGVQIVLQGVKVTRSPYGPITRDRFYAGGKFYNAQSFGHNFRGTDGQFYALMCRKAG